MTQPFQFANGQLAHNAEDLLQLCQQFPHDGVNYLVQEDLEKWLSYIGQDDIARCAASARQAEGDDRQKLAEFLTKCHALACPETEATVAENSIEVSEAKVVQKQPVAKPTPESSQSSSVSPPSQQKPSFFRVIARLIINVLYRNKN